MDVIEQETKTPNARESSLIPEFDRFFDLDVINPELFGSGFIFCFGV